MLLQPVRGIVVRFAVLLLWAVLVFSLRLGAEQPSSSQVFELVGHVLDPSGAVIPGAQVTLFSQGRSPLRTVSTDEQGSFLLAGVVAGSYELVARSTGLEPASVAVTVPAAATRPISVILRVPTLSTTVTVTPGRGEVESAFDTPSQVNIVTRERLETRPGHILPQALHEEVGVLVQQSTPHQGSVIIRGLTGQQVLHLIDGVRFNNSTFRPGPNQYFAMVDSNFVERVEVARGPASAQYGSDSLGGTINVLPLRPYRDAGGRHFHGEFTPFFRSADLAAGGGLRLSYGEKKWSLLGGASGSRVQDLRAGKGGDSHAAVTRFLGLPSSILGDRLQDTGFAQFAGYSRFFWNPSEDHNLSLSYLHTRQHDGRRYDRLNGGNGDLLNSYHPQVLNLFYARYEKLRAGKLDSVSTTFSYNRQRDDRREQGGGGNVLAPIQSDSTIVTAYGYQTQATAHIGTRQSLAFGGEIFDEYIDSDADRFDPVSGQTRPVRARFPDDSRYTTFGLFYQHGVEVWRGRARLVGGLRYSAFNFRTFAASNLLDANGQPLVPDFSTTLHDLTFHLGGTLRLVESLHLVGAVRRGFRAPNATDFSSVGLTSNGFEVPSAEGAAAGGFIGSRSDANAVSTGQPVSGLKPEILYNYELGVKFQRRRMSASVSGFVNDISEFLTKRTLLLPGGAVGGTIGGQTIVAQLPSGAVLVAADPRPVLVRANIGAIRIWGIETAWEAELNDSWRAAASFYYLRGRDQEVGGPPDIEGGLPPATGFVSLRWQPPGKRYWLEAYSNLVSYQDRLSSLEIADQRIGALRSRASISRFFANGAVARGLVSNGILLPTGETLDQVLDRVLGPGVQSAPLFTRTPGFVTANLRGGYQVSEQTDLVLVLENLLDQSYRWHGSGVDGAGVSLQVSYRIRF